MKASNNLVASNSKDGKSNSDDNNVDEETNSLVEVIQGDCILESQLDKQHFYRDNGLDYDPITNGGKDSNSGMDMNNDFESN